MKKSLLALPALAILLGVSGGSATAYAHGLGPAEDLTDEQRDDLATLKELMHDGKIEEAKAFAEEAGLPSLRHGVRLRLDPEKKQALDAALKSGDFTAFTELTANAPFADELTPEAFAKLVESHTLMEAGDMDGAKNILKDLDLHFPMPALHHGFEEHEPWKVELTDEQKDLLDQAHILRQSGDHEGARAIIESLDLPHPPRRHFRE